MDSVITYSVRKRSFVDKAVFWMLLKYLNFKWNLNDVITGLSWMLIGYERDYYDYKTKKLISINGYQYLKHISTDLGEIAFFKVKDSQERTVCERF